MIEFVHGNILEADCEALVNPVNCVGVMGKGLALQFKKAFPINFENYQEWCNDENPVCPAVFGSTTRLPKPEWILNFATKNHWHNKSNYHDIHKGLYLLADAVRDLNIKSIAIPALGCGNGELKWKIVKPLIIEITGRLKDVRTIIYEPHEINLEDTIMVTGDYGDM